jgi:hypothetical protein
MGLIARWENETRVLFTHPSYPSHLGPIRWSRDVRGSVASTLKRRLRCLKLPAHITL